MTDHCLRSRNYVNVIVAGKQPELQWLTMDQAARPLLAWASASGSGRRATPAASPTSSWPAPATCRRWRRWRRVDLLRTLAPELRVRVINIVDLMRLQPPSEHPHGLQRRDFDELFTVDKPIIFAFHGYPWLIHRLTYRRTNHDNLHVRGYKEEGTTTTPFDMTVRNDLDRFHLVKDVAERVPKLAPRAAHIAQAMREKLIEHAAYISQARRGHARDPRLALGRLTASFARFDARGIRARRMLYRGPNGPQTDAAAHSRPARRRRRRDHAQRERGLLA